MYKVLVAMSIVSMFFSAAIKAAGFEMFAGKLSFQQIRAKLNSSEFEDQWKEFHAEALALCDPDSPGFADPAEIDKGFEQQAAATKGSLICRRLHRQIEVLGFAYHFTHDEQFSRHGIKLILSACEKLPLEGEIMSANLPGGKGDMIRALGFSYALFYEQLTPSERKIIFYTAKPYISDAVSNAQNPETGWYKYHNWNGVTGGAVGLVALAIENEYPKYSQKWQKDAVEIVNRWLDNGFDKQGAYLEGVGYTSYGLDNSLLFLAAMNNCKGIDYFRHPVLEKLPQFYALSLLPGENVYEARNDSNYGGIRAQMLALAKYNRNSLAKWLSDNTASVKFWQKIVWDNDTLPLDPVKANVPLSSHFEGRGLCVWRTGWEKDDVMFSIEAGPYYNVTHNQADKGHFTLYGYGRKWACDPGYGNNREPEGRAQTAAHNCVLIDGKGQALSGAGLGTSGKILDYISEAEYGYALADCSDAYNANDRGMEGTPVKKALRHVFFIRPTEDNPAYAVILDDVEKDGLPHDYCWQMLSWPDLEFKIKDNYVMAVPKKDSGQVKMHVFVDDLSDVVIKDGKYTPDDGRKPSTFSRLGIYRKAVNPHFIVILVPTESAFKPDVIFEETDDVKRVLLRWENKTDSLTWPLGDKPLYSNERKR
ncbi:MAG: heparinase II/III family protein [Sedimentisphaeraceae bacterium JB056]